MEKIKKFSGTTLTLVHLSSNMRMMESEHEWIEPHPPKYIIEVMEDVIIDIIRYCDSKDDGGMYLVTSKNEGRHAAQWVLYSKVENITDLLLQLKMKSIQEAYTNVCPLKVSPEDQCNYYFSKAKLINDQCLKTSKNQPQWMENYCLNKKEHHTTMKVITTIHCKLDFPSLYDNTSVFLRCGSYFLVEFEATNESNLCCIPYWIVISMLQADFIPKLNDWTATYWSFLI